MFKYDSENRSMEMPVGGLALKDLVPGMIVCVSVDPGTDDSQDPDTFPWEEPQSEPVSVPIRPAPPATAQPDQQAGKAE